MRLLVFYFVFVSLVFSVGYFSRQYPGQLVLNFFDVGQGDGCLIRLPNGKAMLVDAGGGYGNWDMGGQVLFPELTRLGLRSIKHVLLSHPDQDHLYGFQGVFKHFGVKFWWTNAAHWEKPSASLSQIQRKANAQGTTTKKLSMDRTFTEAGVQLKLYPLATSQSTNNSSLCLLLEFGDCRILFTGDIERRGERELLSKKLPKIDVLKVAHHGSHTSSQTVFLKALKPRLSVISVGSSNPYGHPHPLAIARLHSAGSQILRTDWHGFVRLVVDRKGRVDCSTFLGDCGRFRCYASSD